MQRLGNRLNMTNLRANRNDTSGHTASVNEHRDICVPQNGNYCDDARSKVLTDRIDYLFVERSTTEHGIMIDFTRPRRCSLSRSPATEDFGELPTMSDHIGLETTLIITLK